MTAQVASALPVGVGASAFQLCPPPSAAPLQPPLRPSVERSRSRPGDNSRRRAQRSSGECVPAHAETISAERCREMLGPRSFALLRGAMLQQQDTFSDQLWELHRLARVQGRKSLLVSTEEALGFKQDVRDPSTDIFSRKQQTDLRLRTMNSIVSLPIFPPSLRRKQAAPAAQPPVPDLLGGAPLPSKPASQAQAQEHGYSSSKSPSSHRFTTAPSQGQGSHTHQKQSSLGQALHFSERGSLEALCSQHKVADLPPAPTPTTAPSGIMPGPPDSGAPKSALRDAGGLGAAAWSGLEGLEATLPGSSVDLHSQWYQRNCAQSSAPSNLHDVLNVPIPSMHADPKGAPSNSLWSGQSFMPGGMFGLPAGFPSVGAGSALTGSGMPSGLPAGMDSSMLTNWAMMGAGMHSILAPQLQAPSASGLLNIEPGAEGAAGMQQPDVGLGGSNHPLAYGMNATMPEPPAKGNVAAHEAAKRAHGAGADGKLSNTDKSAASILLSLRGK